MGMILLLILIEDFCRILALGDHHGPAEAMPQDIEQLINFVRGWKLGFLYVVYLWVVMVCSIPYKCEQTLSRHFHLVKEARTGQN